MRKTCCPGGTAGLFSLRVTHANDAFVNAGCLLPELAQQVAGLAQIQTAQVDAAQIQL